MPPTPNDLLPPRAVALAKQFFAHMRHAYPSAADAMPEPAAVTTETICAPQDALYLGAYYVRKLPFSHQYVVGRPCYKPGTWVDCGPVEDQPLCADLHAALRQAVLLMLAESVDSYMAHMTEDEPK